MTSPARYEHSHLKIFAHNQALHKTDAHTPLKMTDDARK